MISPRQRKVIRVLLVLFALALLALVGVVLSFDWLVKRSMIYALGRATGGEVQLRHVRVGLWRGRFQVEQLRLLNPPGFGGGTMLDLPELYFAYDLAAAATNAMHFTEVRLNLAEVGVVIDPHGRTNLLSLGGGLDLEKLSQSQSNTVSHLNFTGIDQLTLSLGQVTQIDLRPPAKTNIIRLGLRNEVLRNVRTGADLMPLVFKLMMSGSLK
ncbi:MAG TPA: hypothetical protein VMB21_03905 [Candidatus Limnocylindria bacterium]|nr:hypothetical protein [Candidatus Limnocylindria bacterium]